MGWFSLIVQQNFKLKEKIWRSSSMLHVAEGKSISSSVICRLSRVFGYLKIILKKSV